jgi:hypothetical protein
MKSTLLVLALAVLSSAGCQAIRPKSDCGQPVCGEPCIDGCGSCNQSCHNSVMRNAPRPPMGGPGGRSGNMEQSCPGGNSCMFDRYRGGNGCGYPCGQYDCSPCGSPRWGCNGYEHPHGYVDNRACICDNGACGQCQQHCPHCGHDYCCTGPAPGCQCCPLCGCGPSGDHVYDFNPGPPVAQTAYPYYTLRGPRDFLMGNPPSIGPY